MSTFIPLRVVWGWSLFASVFSVRLPYYDKEQVFFKASLTPRFKITLGSPYQGQCI